MKVPEWLNIKVAGFALLVTLIVVLFFSRMWTGRETKVHQVKKEGFKTVLDTSIKSWYPYDTSPINSLDQYELEAVFQNEGDRELKQTQINQMTRRYPLDWSFLPPSASRFQSEQAKYIEGFSSPADANSADLEKPYQAIGVGNLTPPDTLQMEKEEKKVLAAYAPSKSQDLTKYDIDDAQELIRRIYEPQGKIPEVVRKENNVFEIIGTRNVHEKIEYEDDLPNAPASSGPFAGVGEATIEVPPAATDTAAGLDPFYEPTTKTRSDRSDYTKWTPGLERMYAPTYPTTDWVNQPSETEANSALAKRMEGFQGGLGLPAPQKPQDCYNKKGPYGFYAV